MSDESTKNYLFNLLKDTNKIYWILLGMSSDRMTRKIKVFCVQESEIFDISFEISKILYYNLDRETRTIKVRGVGFCPGDSIRYDLSDKLFCDSAKLIAKRL